MQGATCFVESNKMATSQTRIGRTRNGAGIPVRADMRLELDAALDVDGHDVALARLRELIGTEDMRERGRLPPERALAEELGVSRRAIRHALGALEAEGRIIRQQGRGTFITDARDAGSSLL